MKDWIWTQRFRFMLWRRRETERLILAVVWRLPRWLVYWSTIRLGAHATTGKYDTTDPTTLPFMDALKRWQA